MPNQFTPHANRGRNGKARIVRVSPEEDARLKRAAELHVPPLSAAEYLRRYGVPGVADLVEPRHVNRTGSYSNKL